MGDPYPSSITSRNFDLPDQFELDKVVDPFIFASIELEDDEDIDEEFSSRSSADPDASEEDVLSSNADKNDSPEQQRIKATGILFQSYEAIQYLRWSWDKLNPHEIRQLNGWIGAGLKSPDPKTQFIAALANICVLTSGSIQRVMDYAIGGKTLGEWALDKNFKSLVRLPPRRTPGWVPDDEAEKWITPLAKNQRLLLPENVVSILKANKPGSGSARKIQDLWKRSWGEKPKSVFYQELTDVIPRATPMKLGNVQPQLIYEECQNGALTRLITSHPNTAMPGACAYTSWNLNGLNNTLGHKSIVGSISTDGKDSENILGSSLAPLDPPLRSAIAKAGKIVASLHAGDDVIAFHNAFSGHLSVALLAATAGRPVGDPFESIAYFDFEHDFVYVNDKESGNYRKGRLVPFPAALSQFIKKHYLPYLKVLAGLYAGINDQMAVELRLMSEGQPSKFMPFLFFLSKETANWTSISEETIKKLGIFHCPLPLN